ncbi:hypothetical protein TWF730_001017 [Orbilia blumenaviensis]|uniref:Uncharacterized protein n=1 Tax=Orbilia blumenaviensis TaxID=1796055 RepID=A0AAV9VQI4_9PEZI
MASSSSSKQGEGTSGTSERDLFEEFTIGVVDSSGDDGSQSGRPKKRARGSLPTDTYFNPLPERLRLIPQVCSLQEHELGFELEPDSEPELGPELEFELEPELELELKSGLQLTSAPKTHQISGDGVFDTPYGFLSTLADDDFWALVGEPLETTEEEFSGPIAAASPKYSVEDELRLPSEDVTHKPQVNQVEDSDQGETPPYVVGQAQSSLPEPNKKCRPLIVDTIGGMAEEPGLPDDFIPMASTGLVVPDNTGENIPMHGSENTDLDFESVEFPPLEYIHGHDDPHQGQEANPRCSETSFDPQIYYETPLFMGPTMQTGPSNPIEWSHLQHSLPEPTAQEMMPMAQNQLVNVAPPGIPLQRYQDSPNLELRPFPDLRQSESTPPALPPFDFRPPVSQSPPQFVDRMHKDEKPQDDAPLEVDPSGFTIVHYLPPSRRMARQMRQLKTLDRLRGMRTQLESDLTRIIAIENSVPPVTLDPEGRPVYDAPLPPEIYRHTHTTIPDDSPKSSPVQPQTPYDPGIYTGQPIQPRVHRDAQVVLPMRPIREDLSINPPNKPQMENMYTGQPMRASQSPSQTQMETLHTSPPSIQNQVQNMQTDSTPTQIHRHNMPANSVGDGIETRGQSRTPAMGSIRPQLDNEQPITPMLTALEVPRNQVLNFERFIPPHLKKKAMEHLQSCELCQTGEAYRHGHKFLQSIGLAVVYQLPFGRYSSMEGWIQDGDVSPLDLN